jgi:tetratricopeptide (TPR) repeat protein
MSSRALRKLGKTSLEDELAKYQKTVDKVGINSDSDNNSNSDSDNEEQIIKKPINAFALLNASDESDQDDESSSESEAEVVEVKINKPESKSKKDKKTIDDLNDDELDKILAKVKIDDKKQILNENNEDSDISDTASFDDDSENEEFLPPWPIYTPGGRLLTPKKLNDFTYLISFDPKDLNPDREYENLFGKLSSAAINDADQTASSSISPEMLNQIKKLARNVRGWSGRDHRSIPGTTRKLKLTKIKDDWLPISKKPLSLDEMPKDNLLNLFTSKFKDDWKEILLEDINKEYKYGIRYYTMSQGPMFSIAATTEFFMSVVVQPDHESLIRLLQKFPYSIETILQVACILQRQGDNTNTNGLVERALFVFDWSLPNQLDLGNGKSRLPFEFFLNRQIYLTIFRNISVLTQKSIYYTAFTYCKLLFSFDPRDDPYGVRYFIDYYAFSSEEFQYLIDFVNSPFCQCYEEWLTAPLLYTASLCYLQLGRKDEAKEALLLAYNKHPFVGHSILEKLGDFSHPWLLNDVRDTVKLTSAIYINRLDLLLEEQSLKKFFLTELALIIEKVGKPNLEAYYWNNLETIPENIIRYVILSNESSVMAKIPESFWSDNEVYEFDVLPPKIGTTIYNYVDDNQISAGVMQNTMRSEEIRQLEDLLQQNIVER